MSTQNLVQSDEAGDGASLPLSGDHLMLANSTVHSSNGSLKTPPTPTPPPPPPPEGTTDDTAPLLEGEEGGPPGTEEDPVVGPSKSLSALASASSLHHLRKDMRLHNLTLSLASLQAPEDNLMGWENNAHGLFTEKTGDELYGRLVDTQFKLELPPELVEENVEVQPKGIISNIEDKFRELKLSFTVNSTLPQLGVEGTPRPVGGSGFAKVVSNPKFPEHPFFRASRIFRVRMRHNNLSFEDDAMLDGRVTCLKFSDDDSGGPLDIILHTGKVPQYYDAESFEKFREAFQNGETDLKNWAYQKPINYYSRVEGVRRAPDSYYDQRYHSQVTYWFTGVDGVERVARMRLLPADGGSETGLPDEEDQENIWDTKKKKVPTATLR